MSKPTGRSATAQGGTEVDGTEVEITEPERTAPAEDDACGAQPPPSPPPARKLGVREVMVSSAKAAFGVQSARDRERDFPHGSAKAFIAAGVIFTSVFVLALVGIAMLVTRLAGT